MGIAHKDRGVATFLQQGEVVGIEVIKDERWVLVSRFAHAFIFMVGDIRVAVNDPSSCSESDCALCDRPLCCDR